MYWLAGGGKSTGSHRKSEHPLCFLSEWSTLFRIPFHSILEGMLGKKYCECQKFCENLPKPPSLLLYPTTHKIALNNSQNV
jgi:hypothetical protein